MAGAKVLSTPIYKGNVLGKNMCPKDEEEMKFMEKGPICQNIGQPHVCHDRHKAGNLSCCRISE